MTYAVKVLGAGSVGNHLSHAARSLGWKVDLCDIDEAALARTKDEIYPARYGAWDPEIRLLRADEAPIGGYDLIIVGTPPDCHVDLAIAAVRERPRTVLVEKPLCTPDLDGAQALHELAGELGVPIFTGYDHVVGKASEKVAELVRDGGFGAPETLDVEFREFWGGIFATHPWLDGPADSYLGYWRRGGGASGEHSHAINLWQHFAHLVGAGRVVEVSAMLDYVTDGEVDYDKLCALNLRTEKGLVGRVVQDVVTIPPRKWARLQGRDGYIEWHCGYKPGCDAVLQGTDAGAPTEHIFQKTRSDDFIQELRHIEAAVANDPAASAISLARGLDTMLVVAAAHKSAQENRVIRIDYTAGYTKRALRPA